MFTLRSFIEIFWYPKNAKKARGTSERSGSVQVALRPLPVLDVHGASPDVHGASLDVLGASLAAFILVGPYMGNSVNMAGDV